MPSVCSGLKRTDDDNNCDDDDDDDGAGGDGNGSLKLYYDMRLSLSIFFVPTYLGRRFGPHYHHHHHHH